MPSRIGLYTPKQNFTNEQLDRAERQFPRPQVDIEKELGQVAIIQANLTNP